MYHAQPMWTQRTARRCLSYEACGRLHAGEQHHTAVHHRLCPNTRPSVVRSSKMRAILRRIQRARLWRNRCTGGRATLFAVCSRRCRQRGRLARKSWPFRGGMLVPAPPASAIPPLSVWPGGTPFGNTQEGPDRPVRPNHRPALSRVRSQAPSPGTTGGPGSLADIRRISLEGKGRRT